MEVEKLVIGIVISIIGYFLKGVMSDIKQFKEDTGREIDKVKESASNNKQDILLLKQESHSNKAYFNEKFDGLLHEIREMRQDVKELNHK